MTNEYNNNFNNNKINNKSRARTRKLRLKGRKYKYIYYNRYKFIKKFAFLSKMKKLWDKIYYTSFVNRLVRADFKDASKPLYYISEDVHNTLTISDFLLFDKYWSRFSRLSKKKLPLWNFSGFDRDLLALKCAWDQRTTDGLFFATKLEQARRTWFSSRAFFWTISILGYTIKVNFFWYILCFLLLGLFSLSYFAFYFTADFDLYGFFVWLDSYMNNERFWDQTYSNQTLAYFMYLYSIQWISDFSYVFLGEGFWTIKSTYYNYIHSWLYVNLNLQHFWFVGMPSFLDNRALGIFYQIQNNNTSIMFDFYNKFALRFIDFFLFPFFFSSILESLNDFYISMKHGILYDFLPDYVLIDFRPYVIEKTWFFVNQYVWFLTSHHGDYWRQWLFVVLGDLEYFRDNIPFLVKSLYLFKKKWLTSKIYLYYFKKTFNLLWIYSFSFIKSFLYISYKILLLDKIMGVVVYILKLLYIYQTIELFLKPAWFLYGWFYEFFVLAWKNSLLPGTFFNTIYKDIIHDFFFFGLEWSNYVPFRDFFFMRRYTVSYLYNWYVFMPTMLDMFSKTFSLVFFYLPAYGYWTFVSSVFYSVQFLASLIFEDYPLKPMQPDLEWLFNQMGFFFVFEKEEGLVRNWFLEFRDYFKMYNDYFFGGTMFSSFFQGFEQEELLSFLYEQRDFNIHWYDYLFEAYWFSDNTISSFVDEAPNVLRYPLDGHRNFFKTINKTIGDFLLFAMFSLSLLVNQTFAFDMSFLGHFRAFFYLGWGYNFDNEAIQLMYRNWLYWQTHVFKYSHERLSTVYKEVQLLLVNKHLLSMHLKKYFPENFVFFDDYISQHNFYINVYDLYVDASWELWSSFEFEGRNFSFKALLDKEPFLSNYRKLRAEPGRMAFPESFDFRDVMEGSTFSFYSIIGTILDYNVFRDFAYYKPEGAFGGANLVDAFYDGIMEAEYDRYTKPNLHSFYDLWGWMHIRNLFTFNLTRAYELSMGYVLTSSNFIWYTGVGGFDSKLIWGDDMSIEEFVYLKDYDGWHRIKDQIDFDSYYKEVIRNYDIISTYPRPYSKMSTDWALLGNLHSHTSKMPSGLDDKFYYTIIPVLNSFDEYWRFMSYYDGSFNILYWKLRESFFAAPLLYTLFRTWRDFFILGVPISIITAEFMPFFPFSSKWSIALLEYAFEMLTFVFYSMQVCIQFFFAIISGNMESLVVIYMIFFSENALVSHSNINVSLFFKFFMWFYDMALFVSNNMVFWMAVKLDSLSTVLFKASTISNNIKKQFDFFVVYGEYKRYTSMLKIQTSIYLKQIEPFYTIYDFYLDFAFSKIHEQKIKEDWVGLEENHNIRGFHRTAKALHYVIPLIPDLYNLSDNSVQIEITKLLNYFTTWVDYYKSNVLGIIDWYSNRVHNNVYYREKFSTTMPFFNMIAEIHFSQKKQYFDTETFPLLMQLHVLNHPALLEYQKLGRLLKLQEGGILHLSEDYIREWRTSSAFNAYFWGQGNLYGNITIRVQRIFGFWYVFDFFFAALCFIFVVMSISATRVFWLNMFPIFDPWWGYVYARYPRLGFLNMQEKRDDLVLRSIEDSSDLLFDEAYFYHQSADYIYLPYRRFSFEAWNQKPAWYFFENNTLDMSLETFFDLGKPYKEKKKKEHYYKKLNKEWDFIMETTKRLKKKKPNFYFKQELRFFPMLDYWFQDKQQLKQENKAQSTLHVITVLSMLTVSIYSTCFEVFRKSWTFNWMFADPDLFFERCWTTNLIKVWPTFFEFFSGFLAIFSFFLFWLVAAYMYRLLSAVFEDFFLLTNSAVNFLTLLCACLIFNVLSSTRYWTGKLLTSRFLHKVSGYYFINYKWHLDFNGKISQEQRLWEDPEFGVDLTSMLETDNEYKGRYSDILEIYQRESSMGLAPLYNKDILKAGLIDNAFFLKDLRFSTLENSLDFVDLQSNKMLVTVMAKQASIISASKFLPMVNTQNDIKAVFHKHSLLTKPILEDFFFNNEFKYVYDAKASRTISKSYKIAYKDSYMNMFFSLDAYDSLYNSDTWVLFDWQLKLIIKDPTKTKEIRGLPQEWNFSGALFQANWSMKRFLQDLLIDWEDFPIKQDHLSFLFRKDIEKFLKFNKKHKPGKVNFEKTPWIVELFQNPFSDAPWVKAPSQLVWPVGGVKPTMPESITHDWRDPDVFLGLCDDFLAYRELLDRSTSTIGAEQAWGFVDIMNKVGNENQEFFFRKEFYKRLHEEKLERLEIKEMWSNFDISLSEPTSETPVSEGFWMSDTSIDPTIYRHFFLTFDDNRANIMPYGSYSKLSELRATRDFLLFDDYDEDYIFNLDFGFDYYNLD